MRGVILAGGNGTRLYPITKIINKNFLPVGKYPMFYYSIEKLREVGIEDILIVMGKHSAGLYTNFLGSGKEWGVRITYKIQDEAGGIAEALELAKDFIRPDDKFVVLLGDNLFEDALTPWVQKFESQEKGAQVVLKEVEDPHRYGVPTLVDNQIIWIEEKPSQPKSRFCVTGIYMYDYGVFEVIKQIKRSERGELEITDVNNHYASDGTLTYSSLNGWWNDAGTFASLYEASRRFLDLEEDQP